MNAHTTVGLCVLAVSIAVVPAGPPVELAEREPAAAGRFYPADPGQLEGAVRAYLAEAVEPEGDAPLALIAPHAGYIFSGQIAADAYRQVMGQTYDLVVILGTNHTTPGFRGVSVYRGSGYRTPLGLARIDLAVADALIDADESFTFEPRVHASEHSVEVQVPFVQIAFPGVKIVTAVIGRPDPDLCRRFGRALARVVGGRRALIVASSDLSHYPAYDDAVKVDHATLGSITSMSPATFRTTTKTEMDRQLPNLVTCACGAAPILAVMEAARVLGARSARVISYANSGDTAAGNRDRVVGYGAVGFYAARGGPEPEPAPGGAPANSSELTPQDKHALLAFARESIRRYLTTGTAPLARDYSGALRRKQGAFVTLKIDGRLRGCRGFTAATYPIYQLVGTMALQSAFNDSRFPPLRGDELDRVEIEISLLTPLERVAGPQEIVTGRDGVRIRKDGKTAIFLPQVAVEQGWDRQQYLDQLCRKAGLPPGSWKRDAELYTFQAEVFGEADDA